MIARLLIAFTAGIVVLCLTSNDVQTAPAQEAVADVSLHQAFVQTYCVGCHNQRTQTAGLALDVTDLARVPADAELWEKVIRKLRTGAMPPQNARQPDENAVEVFVSWIETTIDREAAARPNPGRAVVPRLNRTEYANAVRDLLALDIDVESLLPPDDESYGFDNIADVLKTSPSLLQRYMAASWNISRLAVGNPAIIPDTAVYRARPDLSQDGHIEGLPFGTRGGMTATHHFALDGEYEIRVRLWRATADIIKGLEEPHQLEISVDGTRVRLITFGGPADRDLSYENPGKSAEDIDRRLTVRVPVQAGPRTIVATFLKGSDAHNDGILQPFLRTNLDPLGYRGLPAVDRLSVTGPFSATGPGDTPSRRQIFVCRPANPAEELSCAERIVTTLAQRAYRRPVSDDDMQTLLSFYQRARNEDGDFERGIEAAVQFILASPDFLFRFDSAPAEAAEGAVYRIDDLALASRLSFFLWSTIPDEELLNAAMEGRLQDSAVLESQVRRMLSDDRSKALVENFAGQWLYLRNLKNINPDFETFPDFDDNLRQAMRRETELFVESIMREDRSILDLLDADYTFLNERLARHYGVSRVYGSHFRRVAVDTEARRGMLGHASILTITSYSNRTSPVQRGKWILTNILGIPPAPPPPEVEGFDDQPDPSRPASLRERLEEHRANPACASCHNVMDPIGFALENFDAVGRWRATDHGVPVDPTGVLFNGASIDGPVSLRRMLTSRPENFAGVFTERLLTYALGRGIQYYDMPAVRAILSEAEGNDFRFSSIVMGIIKSTPFQMKVKAS